MEAKAKVAISSDFLTAFAALPRQIQGKVTEFINKFRNNPQSPGINYEKINGGRAWHIQVPHHSHNITHDTNYSVFVEYPVVEWMIGEKRVN